MTGSSVFFWLCAVAALGLGLASAVPSTWLETHTSDLIRVAGTIVSVIGGVGLWLLKKSSDRRQDDERARKRRERMLVALRSELALNIEGLARLFAPETSKLLLAAAKKNMAAASKGEHSMPMAVTVDENTVFDSLKDEVSNLPDRTIGPVIRYYFNDRNVNETLRSFSEGKFEGLPPARKEAALAIFYSFGTDTLASAFTAYDEVNAQLSDDPIVFSFDEEDLRKDLSDHLGDEPKMTLNAPAMPVRGLKR